MFACHARFCVLSHNLKVHILGFTQLALDAALWLFGLLHCIQPSLAIMTVPLIQFHKNEWMGVQSSG